MTNPHAEHEVEHEEEEPLRFIASPLKHGSTHYAASSNSGDLEASKGATATSNELQFERDSAVLDTPEFHRHEAAQSVELFYDLFFVANLTTFTANHNINSPKTMSSYVGFFCVLWFTWYQTCLFDVRFGSDSIVERFFKLAHFGIMMGFAAVGSAFDPSDVKGSTGTFKQLTLLLMASRLALAAQYSITFFYTRKFKSIRWPLIAVIGMEIIAAILYMALFFAFVPGKNSLAYITWYIIAVTETLLTTVVSCRWRVISFKGTHLQERLSLLTLIILGEGIILLCKSISYIVKANLKFQTDTVGAIICALLVIYLYYMIYFDRVVEHHFGTIRQQIWGYSHFFLHVAMVLALEGTRQFTIWRQAIIILDGITNKVWDTTLAWLSDPSVFPTPDEYTSYTEKLTNYSDKIFENAKDIDLTSYKQTVDYAIGTMSNIDISCLPESVDDACAMAWTLFDTATTNYTMALTGSEFTMLGIKPKKPADKTKKLTPEDVMRSYDEIFNFIFKYFFITTGLTLIIIGAIHWISTPPKKLGDFIRGGSNFVIGIGLCLLTIMSAFPDKEFDGPYERYQYSSWILPTLVISLLINVVLNHARRPGFMKKLVKTH